MKNHILNLFRCYSEPGYRWRQCCNNGSTFYRPWLRSIALYCWAVRSHCAPSRRGRGAGLLWKGIRVAIVKRERKKCISWSTTSIEKWKWIERAGPWIEYRSIQLRVSLSHVAEKHGHCIHNRNNARLKDDLQSCVPKILLIHQPISG